MSPVVCSYTTIACCSVVDPKTHSRRVHHPHRTRVTDGGSKSTRFERNFRASHWRSMKLIMYGVDKSIDVPTLR